MRILVSGGTGFIGQALCPQLAQEGHDVVVWSRQANPDVAEGVSAIQRLDELSGPDPDAVINLAGASIADGRWTEARKRLLVDSRLETTGKLVEWMRAMESPPKALISASAVGYYGEQGDRVITEDTPPTSGFTHDLCDQWENEALKAEALGVRVCLVRTGVVLDRDGGALAKMLLPFKLGTGGRLGSGEHYFPWIHRADIVGIYQWLVENEQASGAYNASAPKPVTNAEFTRALGRALKRPTLLPMPEPVLRLLFGEMSELLLVSNRMMPKRLLDEGFEFRYPELKQALHAILG
ncbi:TIGR01777 family oxidoreductase [Thioalkalivibrio sp.]|uniref:TIGR01777 family oxidoreductase n=1 Tax=Thioalkalivibrio sp. TaxID=2093813 RepID=UPI0012D569A1|nr:TIGR01777 family oxidoreductase [Thioalkalivibrio sp.]TVP79443.1 MAG: TIGR01777 family protein [Thioalkalivibrio sp.]